MRFWAHRRRAGRSGSHRTHRGRSQLRSPSCGPHTAPVSCHRSSQERRWFQQVLCRLEVKISSMSGFLAIRHTIDRFSPHSPYHFNGSRCHFRARCRPAGGRPLGGVRQRLFFFADGAGSGPSAVASSLTEVAVSLGSSTIRCRRSLAGMSLRQGGPRPVGKPCRPVIVSPRVQGKSGNRRGPPIEQDNLVRGARYLATFMIAAGGTPSRTNCASAVIASGKSRLTASRCAHWFPVL